MTPSATIVQDMTLQLVRDPRLLLGMKYLCSNLLNGKILYGQLLARHYQAGGRFTADAEVPASVVIVFTCSLHQHFFTSKSCDKLWHDPLLSRASTCTQTQPVQLAAVQMFWQPRGR